MWWIGIYLNDKEKIEWECGGIKIGVGMIVKGK